MGKISKWDPTRQVYVVQYDNSLQTHEYNARTIIEPILIANIGKGTRMSMYSCSEDSFYDAEITDVDDSKMENFFAHFDSGMDEWIDVRRYKYHILNAPNGKIKVTGWDSNLAVITEKSQDRPRSTSPDTADSRDSAGAPNGSTSNGETGKIVHLSKKHPFPNVKNISGPAPTDIAFVDRGTVVAIRWKRPYILYDATVVKMKDDGSQYLLQYHYDSATKWVDLRKTEFYVIGVDSTFQAALDDGGSRPSRRARKSEDKKEDQSRKRRRVDSTQNEDVKPQADTTTTETAIQTIKESQMNDFQNATVKQLTVGSRIAIWTRLKEYRKATVMSFPRNRDEFEVQYDTERQARKINLKQNAFLVLESEHGKDEPRKVSRIEALKHQNPDINDVTVGTRVSVLWEGDMKYYTATVLKIKQGEDEPFFIKYDDGEEEWIHLGVCKFKIEKAP